MTSTYMPRHEIESRAQYLRELTGRKSIPVDVASIAQILDVDVKYERLSNEISGALMRKDGKAVIAINSDHGPSRRTFTLAHELGHYWLHQTDDVFLDKVVMHRNSVSSRGDDFKEIQANQFAASLLMPKVELDEAFDALLEKSQDRKQLIEMLARQFAVSQRAMELRLVNLALIAVDDDGGE